VLIAAPAALTQRQIKLITIVNRDPSVTNTVVVKKLITATYYYQTPVATLLAGESMQYMDGQGWVFYTATGSQKVNGTTAAGANTDVLYNNNGVIAGDSGFTYNTATEVVSITNAGANLQMLGGLTTPAAPPANTLSIFARSVANRMMTAQIGPTGLMTSLQPLLARNKVGYWSPPGNNTTLPGVFGITAPTANGTAVAVTRNVATTTLATRMRRIGYPTASAAANLLAGVRLAVAQFTCGSGSATDGSGFWLIERWVESDPAPVAGRRAFHGMTATLTAFAFGTEVNALLNQIGIMQLSTDATQWYWIGAGSAAQAAVAVGTGIGAPGGNSTTAWELAIFAPASVANTYYLLLTNITTGVTATQTFTGAATVVPQSATLLAWQCWATNNLTALATGVDLCSLYIETDN
jgi:hypothetical protein